MADSKKKPPKPKAKAKAKPKPRKPRARRPAQPVNRNTNTVRVNVVHGGGEAPSYAGPDRGYFAFNPVFDAGGPKQPAFPPANIGPAIAAGPVNRTAEVQTATTSPAGVALGGWEAVGYGVDSRWVPTGPPQSRTPIMEGVKLEPEGSALTRWAKSQLSSELSPTTPYDGTPDDFANFYQAARVPLPPSTARPANLPPPRSHHRFPTGVKGPQRRLLEPSASRTGSSSVQQELVF